MECGVLFHSHGGSKYRAHCDNGLNISSYIHIERAIHTLHYPRPPHTQGSLSGPQTAASGREALKYSISSLMIEEVRQGKGCEATKVSEL